MKTIIVGGVAGGASCAARLRRLDESAEIILVERGPHISYANCGLPYYIGGEIAEEEALFLQTPDSFYRRFHVDVYVNTRVVSIHPRERYVVLENENGMVYEESYDSLVLSPGAKPRPLSIVGLPQRGVFTLRDVPDTLRIEAFLTEEKPKRAAIVGGGFIGLEMAENLLRRGLKVSIIEAMEHLLPPLDGDMAAEVHHYAMKKGLEMHFGRSVAVIEKGEGGLRLSGEGLEIKADMVLLSAGVVPDTDFLTDSGIALTSRGAIVVDQNMRTNYPDIYAVGDAVQVTHYVGKHPVQIPLAGPANKQGRIAADNIAGIPSTYLGSQGSSILRFFEQSIAVTGLNEAQAMALDLDYDKVYTLSPSHAGYYPGGGEMSIKTLFERGTGRILGAQIVGYDGVDKRCDVLAVAIRGGMTAYDLSRLDLCYAPPFSSAKDPVNMIGYVIENVLMGQVQNAFWQDIPALLEEGEATFLDVRTAEEWEAGHIPGFLHIPLDELREHMAELDMEHPVYVCCRSGMRSYIACCILSGYGFNSYNLSGGYRLYDSLATDPARKNEEAWV
ncbi:FAD-dependent oxidoreductase [Eubacteriales bacterium OttesenSCG-928-M02]|nr:FAD-dependent oxidoreductase [Eubacteriales bacterium OttesenSCG-928-M02]